MQALGKIKSMKWFSENAGDIGSLALLVVAQLGILVAFVHNITHRTPAKIGFMAAFLIVAGIAWYANKIDHETSETSITGGKNFFYFRAEELIKGEKIMRF